MGLNPLTASVGAATDSALQVYLLGTVPFEAALGLQRRLAYQISGDPSQAALILCEHPPLITVGREGSRRHILCEPEELRARQWAVRWVNRGGGCWLHLPGQLAIYPIIALERFNLGLEAYLQRLQGVLAAVLGDFDIRGARDTAGPGIRVGGRPIAALGAAVRQWVAYYGAVLNVCPALGPYQLIRSGKGEGPMTSLERERGRPLRVSRVRESVVEHFAARFRFARTTLFFDHPALPRKARTDAVAARS